MLPQLAVSVKILCLLMVVICGAVSSVVRNERLYSHCSHKYVKIYPNGSVMATDDSEFDQYHLLEISAVNINVDLLIYGKKAGRFLCFNRKWKLVGIRLRREEAQKRRRCLFQENMTESAFTNYASTLNPKMSIWFNKQGTQTGIHRQNESGKQDCTKLLKKGLQYSITEHNNRVAGADSESRGNHWKRSNRPLRPKQWKPDKLRHAHSRHLARKKKPYDSVTT